MHFFKKKAVAPIVISETQEGHRSRPVSASSKRSHDTVDIPVSGHGTIIRKANCCQQCCSKENLKEQALLIATIVSVVLGIVVGIALRGLKCSTGKNING
jgi:hypothetical protein